MAKQFKVKYKGDKPPIPFDITFEQVVKDESGAAVEVAGVVQMTEVTEKFMARGVIPGALMMQVAGATDPAAQVAGMMQFMSAVVVPEDRERFVATLNNSDPPIDLAMISEIAEWLMEQYGDRPTG